MGLDLDISTLVELNYSFYWYNLLVLMMVVVGVEEVVLVLVELNYFDYLYYLHYASFQYALLDCNF